MTQVGVRNSPEAEASGAQSGFVGAYRGPLQDRSWNLIRTVVPRSTGLLILGIFFLVGGLVVAWIFWNSEPGANPPSPIATAFVYVLIAGIPLWAGGGFLRSALRARRSRLAVFEEGLELRVESRVARVRWGDIESVQTRIAKLRAGSVHEIRLILMDGGVLELPRTLPQPDEWTEELRARVRAHALNARSRAPFG